MLQQVIGFVCKLTWQSYLHRNWKGKHGLKGCTHFEHKENEIEEHSDTDV